MKPTKTRWKRLLAAPLIVIAVIVILVEEWLWDDLARLAAAIGRLPVFRQIERFVGELSPYRALAVFAAPSLLLLPIKLISLYFISHRRLWLGILVALVGKIVGTAMVARIYALTKNSLLRIAWFARWHDRFMAFKAKTLGAIKASEIYQRAHRLYLRMKTRLREFFGARGKSFLLRRWRAALEFSRRWKQS